MTQEQGTEMIELLQAVDTSLGGLQVIGACIIFAQGVHWGFNLFHLVMGAAKARAPG